MTSPVVATYEQELHAGRARRPDPDLSRVALCVAHALSLDPADLAEVTARVRAAIAVGTLHVTAPHDASGKLDESRLPPLPPLPRVAVRARRGSAGERRVASTVASCHALSPTELTLITQAVRAALATREGDP